MRTGPSTLPPPGFARTRLAVLGQKRGNPTCPKESPLSGATALVTGATGGIGVEIARGLLARGLDTIVTGRNPNKIAQTLEAFREEGSAAERLLSATFDLADLETISSAVEGLARRLSGRSIQVLVENAGVWPSRYGTTKQGYEVAYGTNVLGHFVLRRRLQSAGLLAADARVVVLTGDIYCRAADCTPDYHYAGPLGGMQAYCRSKLGNVWAARELQRRSPQLTVAIVHPGVIASNLGGGGAVGRFLKSLFMLSPARGAQMPLICATQPDILPGGYYHNAVGLASFPTGDPALEDRRAELLWRGLEAQAASFSVLHPSNPSP